MQTTIVLQGMLMYVVMPIWLLAGFADYLCHRAAHIEQTSGWKESVLHLLQFAEMGVPVMAALFFEINASIILLMIVCLVLHEATAIWDVRYANRTRDVPHYEQHIHSVLEMLPLMALLIVIALHFDQFLGLFGLAPARWDIALKAEQLPVGYIATLLGLTLLLEFLPYLEELLRGLRAAARRQT